MKTTNKINYRAMAEAPFDMDSKYESNFKMLVYTGQKEEERPVFRVVIAKGECKVMIGSPAKELWGIIGLDPRTGENQWYNYNDCVSLEEWAVLDRFLEKRFGWMRLTDPAIEKEVRIMAKAQLREG